MLPCLFFCTARSLSHTVIDVFFDEWFLDDVKLCFKWYQDGARSGWDQCGGGVDKYFCADIDKYTPEYLDDTNGRDGGCQMAWMLKVPSDSPEWLLNRAKLCFKFSPTDNRGRAQCEDSLSGEYCVRANEWTDYYRDDTDGRPGGCVMKWKLDHD